MGTLLDEAGDLVMQHMEKAEVLNATFVWVFTSKTSCGKSQVPRRKCGARMVYASWKRIGSETA